MKKTVLVLMLGTLISSVAFGGIFDFLTKGKDQEKIELTIRGSTTVLPIGMAVTEAFAKEHKGSRISVTGGGSSTGIKALLDGSIDIAEASRNMKDKEMELAKEKGMDDIREIVVAYDGLAVIVNPANPIEKMSMADLKKIYLGEIDNWSEVGGDYEEIVRVGRDSASGTYEAFHKIAMEKEDVATDTLASPSNNAVLQQVKEAENAIGYVGLGYLDDEVKALTMDGIFPTVPTVKSFEYPISRALYWYTRDSIVEEKAGARELIDFMLGDKGQQIVSEQGFVRID